MKYTDKVNNNAQVVCMFIFAISQYRCRISTETTTKCYAKFSL